MTTSRNASIELSIAGLGFVFYSPHAVRGIGAGEDFLLDNFEKREVVAQLAMDCQIVGVGTGSPGVYVLDFRWGYPDKDTIASSEFSLRIGLDVKDRMVCIRDLYDFMDWDPECPAGQILAVPDDCFYHLTLLSNRPSSGIVGDSQRVLVYVQSLTAKPALRYGGVPTLC